MLFRIFIAAAGMALSGLLCAQDNVALDKPVFEIGAPFGIGVEEPGVPPGVATDGTFLPAGDAWYHGSWWLDSLCGFEPPHPPGDPPPPAEPCALEIELQGWYRIDSFIFQGDSDAYLLQYWLEGSPSSPPHWELAWEVPEASGGLQTRPDPGNNEERHVLDEPIITNRLRVQVHPDPARHDDYNSVSELQAFGQPSDPCSAAGGRPVGMGCWSGEPEFQTHAAVGDLCYRLQFTCEGFVHGGFGTCLYPDGYFDLGMDAQLGDPPAPEDPPAEPGQPACGMGGGHRLNDEVEVSCSLDDQGKVNLKVRQVRMNFCDLLP